VDNGTSQTGRTRGIVARVVADARPKVVGQLKGIPRRAARTLVRTARGATASRILNEELLDAGPADPADIIGNYFRGYVPLGDSNRPGEVAWGLVQPRAVIDAEHVHVPDRVRRYSRNTDLTIDLHAPLDPVLEGCADREWTWITPGVIAAWRDLDRAGYVRACGAYRDGELLAGLWGMQVGSTFSIMSIFHRESRAGTVLLARVMGELDAGVDMIDCGFISEHMPRFGAYEIPLEEFKRRSVDGLRAAPVPDEPSA
jgi:leucyl/phenylalanyl-tRNA--protein transferase